MENEETRSPLSQDKMLLWRAYEGSLIGLGDSSLRKEALFFHAAQPDHYVRHYKLTTLQWVMNPFSCRRVLSGQRQLSAGNLAPDGERKTIARVNAALAKVEFGDLPLSHQQRWRARYELLCGRVTPRELRSAMQSCATVVDGRGVKFRFIPASVYWPMRIARDIMHCIAVGLVALALAKVIVTSCITCSELGMLQLGIFSTGLAHLCHILGPEWKKSQQIATKLFPANFSQS